MTLIKNERVNQIYIYIRTAISSKVHPGLQRNPALPKHEEMI